MWLPNWCPQFVNAAPRKRYSERSSCFLHSQKDTMNYLISFNSLSLFLQKKKVLPLLWQLYHFFFSSAFMKLLMWKCSFPRQLIFKTKSCMGLVSLHLTLFNFHSGVHKMAISIMHSMFPDREDCRHSKYPSKPSFSSTKHVVCSTHTSAELSQACYYCFFIIIFYNPPLHTRARFTSSYNALTSSSNPLVVSQAPQLRSLFKTFCY